MRILITGITGFVGGHLTEALRAEGGHTITGYARHPDWSPAWAHLTGAADLRAGEVGDKPAVERLLHDVRPDWLFHLAGFASPNESKKEPDRCWADNLDGTRSLYDAILASGLKPRVLFVSTGLVYGDAEGEGPLDETALLRPETPYAASKAAADLLSYQYFRMHELSVVRVRLFNQIGPRQSTEDFSARFASQIADAEAGKKPPVIETRDLSGQRDLTDVRDMIAAFRLLIERGAVGEVYNAGRGRTWRIQDVLDRLLALSKVKVEVKQRVEPGRKADTAITRADTTKLRRVTGWEPKYDLDRTLKDVLDYWREVARS